MQSPPGPETLIDGVRYLYFGGTSYLGLAARPEVIEAGCEAMRRFGVHTATSRAGFGNSPPVLEVERRAAEFFGTEDAFYFASGYVANHILVAALTPTEGTVLVDEAAHYCVREAARLSGLPVTTFRHRDPEDLARLARGRGAVLVMADAVEPATGWLAPVPEYLAALSGLERAWLLLDDAHGFGVLGEAGRGRLDELHLWPRVNAWPASDGVNLHVCGTLAKALGGHGGILPGSREFLARVRASSHYFSGSSAPAAAVAGATAKALEIVSSEPELRSRLRENVRQLREGLRGLGLEVPEGATAQVGLPIGDAANMRRIHQELKARGILVPYFDAYSGLPPEGVLRFAVFATHTGEQIARLLATLRSLL
ncbi:MAG: aminotransferase class I/II-fold pyridoxal phosphate-dependent enzyme [Verrucomicrobiae bacterium]|nr:aminotransferase class I/II-fold pyridoxal phosphate-dependent enzyme [Verrucomicrobiae bacterium]